MNKRIRELYNQSLVVQNDDAQWIESELDSEKFAELIVRECADFSRQHNLQKADRSYMIHRAIKEHFGVEE